MPVCLTIGCLTSFNKRICNPIDMEDTIPNKVSLLEIEMNCLNTRSYILTRERSTTMTAIRHMKIKISFLLCVYHDVEPSFAFSNENLGILMFRKVYKAIRLAHFNYLK